MFLIITISLFIANQGKPFFTQKRPGKDERVFHVIKFKTMNEKKDTNGVLLADKFRLTTVGRFLRKSSLDEIPQLINVIKGDMSFIGPRPLLIRYLPYYTNKEKARHTVRPGITGLAQVSGRNLLNWDDRLAMDVQYVENLSFAQDVRIILRTIKNVLISKDIVVDPNSVIQDFDEYRSKN